MRYVQVAVCLTLFAAAMPAHAQGVMATFEYQPVPTTGLAHTGSTRPYTIVVTVNGDRSAGVAHYLAVQEAAAAHQRAARAARIRERAAQGWHDGLSPSDRRRLIEQAMASKRWWNYWYPINNPASR